MCPVPLWIVPTYTKENAGQLQSTGSPHEAKCLHVEEATLPLAITIESNSASHNTSEDVDGDSEQVGASCTVSNL